MRCRRAPRLRVMVRGNSWKSRAIRSFSGRAALRNKAQGMKQRFFDNAARKLRVGTATRYLLMFTWTPPGLPKS